MAKKDLLSNSVKTSRRKKELDVSEIDRIAQQIHSKEKQEEEVKEPEEKVTPITKKRKQKPKEEKSTDDKVSTTIEFDEDVFTQMKVHLAMNRLKMRDYVQNLVKDDLAIK